VERRAKQRSPDLISNRKETTLLAIGAHPDDAELGCGGLLASLADKGHRVGIIDLTRGEMGSSGSPEIRAEEARRAGAILGIDFRLNLDMGDGQIVDSQENRLKLAQAFREYKPTVVATSHPIDRHPDHSAATALVKAAALAARLPKMPLNGSIHCVTRILLYCIHDVATPSFIVDISSHFEKKREALEAYHSQFVKPERGPEYRMIGVKDYIQTFASRAIHYGSQIGVQYGEAYVVESPIRVMSPERILDI